MVWGVRCTRSDVGFCKQWEVVGDEKRRVNYFGRVDWEFFFGVIIVRCGLLGETIRRRIVTSSKHVCEAASAHFRLVRILIQLAI
jgi:hypothetical protein